MLNQLKRQRKKSRNTKKRYIKKEKRDMYLKTFVKERQESKRERDQFEKKNYMSFKESLEYTKSVLSNVIETEKKEKDEK